MKLFDIFKRDPMEKLALSVLKEESEAKKAKEKKRMDEDAAKFVEIVNGKVAAAFATGLTHYELLMRDVVAIKSAVDDCVANKPTGDSENMVWLSGLLDMVVKRESLPITYHDTAAENEEIPQ